MLNGLRKAADAVEGFVWTNRRLLPWAVMVTTGALTAYSGWPLIWLASSVALTGAGTFVGVKVCEYCQPIKPTLADFATAAKLINTQTIPGINQAVQGVGKGVEDVEEEASVIGSEVKGVERTVRNPFSLFSFHHHAAAVPPTATPMGGTAVPPLVAEDPKGKKKLA